jgi:hypothetical protein
MDTKFRRLWQRSEGNATFTVEKFAEGPIYLMRPEGHLYDTSSPDCIDHERALGRAHEFVKRQSPECLIWDLTGTLSAERQMRIDLKGYDTVLDLDGCKTVMVLGENLDAETRAALQPKFRQAPTIDEALWKLMKADETKPHPAAVAAAGVGNAAQSVTVKGVIYKDDKILIGSSLGRTLIGLLAVITVKGLWGFVAGAAFGVLIALVVLVQLFWHLKK